MNNSPVSDHAESLLLSPSSAHHERHPETSAASSEWSTGCFGIEQERFHWTDFCSNMETYCYKAIREIFIAVRPCGISCSGLFVCSEKHTGMFIFCIRAHLPARLLCISACEGQVVFPDPAFPPCFCLP